MIKLSILMVRRSDLTYEQFIQHWGEVHGPLVAAQSESKQYVRRYIQDHRTSDATNISRADGTKGKQKDKPQADPSLRDTEEG